MASACSNKLKLTGQRFGRLVVIREIQERNHEGKTQWECLCDCGNTKIAVGRNLKRGTTKSCGCLHSEQARKARGSTMKTCKRCGQEKPSGGFYNNKKNGDGKDHICRSCRNIESEHAYIRRKDVADEYQQAAKMMSFVNQYWRVV